MASAYEITTRMLRHQQAAVTRHRLPADELPRWLPRGLRTVTAYLEQYGVTIAGAPFSRYLTDGHMIEVETGYPVSTVVPGDELVRACALPGGPAATLTVAGAPFDLDEAHRMLEKWLAEQGFVGVGPQWEIYDGDRAAGEKVRPTEVVAPYLTRSRRISRPPLVGRP